MGTLLSHLWDTFMDENLPATSRTALVVCEGVALALAFACVENFHAGKPLWVSLLDLLASGALSYLGFKWNAISIVLAAKWNTSGQTVRMVVGAASGIVVGSLFTVWLRVPARPMVQGARPPSGQQPSTSPEPSAPFTLDVLSCYGGKSNSAWGLDTTGTPPLVLKIDLMLQMRVINWRHESVTLDSLDVELATPRGWMLLRFVSISPGQYFVGPLDGARPVLSTTPPLLESAINSPLLPDGGTMEALGFYELSDQSYLPPPRIGLFRITARDTRHREFVAESTINNIERSISPLLRDQYFRIDTGPARDLSKYRVITLPQPNAR
jgi:hypothetical protein